MWLRTALERKHRACCRLEQVHELLDVLMDDTLRCLIYLLGNCKMCHRRNQQRAHRIGPAVLQLELMSSYQVAKREAAPP
jgi:hypothetical protein